ncbi:TadE/TadG family type IV pilus assembly protein [Pasteurella sp. PK-2025]|uniref:TadE/TadG family type IV pilus assembly protein n=1 Tax=Pasteurella sp. PK-2025 TaxID=3413133 RepID=UPI003C7737B4
MKRFISNKKGVSTIEFGLTVGIYFFVVMMIFEFCRLAIATTYWDLAIAESVRITKNTENKTHDYKTFFKATLEAQKALQDTSTMGYLAQTGNSEIKVDVKYVDCPQEKECVKALLANRFREPKTKDGKIISPTGQNATLAYYTLTYDYRFVVPLPFIPTSWTQSILNREFVVVQEYERSSFSRPN